MAPCSVKACGRYLMLWPRPLFKVAICDLERWALFSGELEHEIFREALGIALDLLVESLGGHPVDRGELAVEDDALTSACSQQLPA